MATRPFDPDFLDALETLVIPWQGSAWRQVFEGTDAFRENTRGGRWNPAGLAALYASLTPEGAAAEIDNLAALQTIPIRRARVTYEIGVSLVRVADLRDFSALAAFDVGADTMFGDDWTGPQRVASAVAWLDCRGLLVPSARHSSSNLVIFPNNLAAGDDIREIARTSQTPSA